MGRSRLASLALDGAKLGGTIAARTRSRLVSTFSGPSPIDADALRAEPPGEVVELERPDGATVWTVVAGEGPTVVLTHGYSLRTASWNLVANALVDRGYRVIGLDWRGHGRSTTGDEQVTTDQLIGDLIATLEHHDVQDAVLVGHSTGGYVSIATLVERPEVAERLRGLVLAASLAGELLSDEPDGQRGISDSLGPGVVGRVFGNEALRLLLGGVVRSLDESPTVAEVFLEQFTNAEHTTLVRLIRQLAEKSYYDRLDEIDVPTVVLCGQADETTPPEHARALADGIADSRLVWMPDVGHLLTWYRPTEIVDAIESLTSSQAESGPGVVEPPASAVFILNPASGTHDADETQELVTGILEESGMEVEVRRTEGEGDARQWAAEVTADGSDVDLVVAAGGDGTVREAVSGAVDGDRDVPVAIIPMGTANLLARALDVPVDDIEAAAAVAAGLGRRPLDVMHLVDRDEYAILMIDAGFDAQLVRDSTRGLKDVIGPLAYVVSGVRNAFGLREVDVELTLDGNRRQRDAHSVLCLNVGQIGETVVIDRDVQPDDGSLHVAVISRPRPWNVLSTALGMVFADRGNHPNATWSRGRHLQIEADPPLELQVDGDPAGETPVEVRLLPSAVVMVVPVDDGPTED